jgi:hypothetical protein
VTGPRSPWPSRLAALALAGELTAAAAPALELTVDAPPALAAAADRVRLIDENRLRDRLAAAGLELPARAHVTLVPEDDPRARETPRWIVGQARWPDDIVVFPNRTDRFPFQSLESVLTHEIVHLALTARAGGRSLPRWFQEGVAVSIEGGFGVERSVRLLFATLGQPAITDVTRLFASESQPQNERAYLLAGAIVEAMRGAHGAGAPGAIAAHVAAGVPFVDAFERETGDTPDRAAARTWRTYQRWTSWVSFLGSPSATWNVILLLAFAAFFVRLYRRARRRRAWDEEERLDDRRPVQ